MDKDKMNKFQQELYLRENPEAETPEEMQDMLTNQYRSIIRSRISSPYNYKAKKFVSLCSKINEEFDILTKDINKSLCVVHRIPAKSLPPNCINILDSQLTEMGFDVHVDKEYLPNSSEGEEILYYKIRIRCKEEVTRDEKNNEDRNTELSEPQEHND